MTRVAVIAALLTCIAAVGAADSITIDGVKYEDVYVREGATRYFVQIPADGRTISVEKDKVKAENVSISVDANQREAWLTEWRRSNAIRRGEPVSEVSSSSPPPQDAGTPIRTNARILHFPEDGIGHLEVKDAPEHRRIEEFIHWVDAADWRFLALAKGDVMVPEGTYVALHINEPARGQTSPLAALDPNDIFEARLAAKGDNPAPGDAMLGYLTRLTGLRVLSIQFADVTEQGLAALTAFHSLKRLTLPNGVDDRGFAHVASIPSVEGLYFWRSRVTVEGLGALENLPLLTELSFGGDELTDAHLVHLAKLHRLDYLRLSGENISDAGMLHVAKVPSLRVLNLSYLRIGDEGVGHIAALPNLEILSLYNVPAITGKALAYLRRVPALRKLDLNDRAGCASPRFTAEDMVHVAAHRSLEDLSLPDTMGDDAL